MESDLSKELKEKLNQAKKYAEGRGIGIPVEKKSIIDDIEKLITFKLMY